MDFANQRGLGGSCDEAGPTGAIAVVGGGMLGAAVADALTATGRPVVLLEAAPALGGLASAWTIEAGGERLTWDRFYHVVLGQDRRVIALLRRLGLETALHFTTVDSELLAGGRVLPMSSVLDLLRLPVLGLPSRLRVGATVAAGALLPLRGGDRITSAAWLRRWSGRAATQDLWRPLLRAKLGEEADQASARFIRSTFRRLLLARLRGGDGDRFGWVEGGYAAILGRLAAALADAGVQVRTSTPVTSIEQAKPQDGGRWRVGTAAGEDLVVDDVVVTTPGPVARRLIPLPGDCEGATEGVHRALERVRYLGCISVSVVLRRQVTGGYLTYVTDQTPYTAVVEMTNLVDRAQTGGMHLVYLPRYCAPDDPDFDEADDVIAERAVTDLLRRYPALVPEDVVATRVAKARNVMPVPVPGSGDGVPPVATGLPGLYLASSAQVSDGTLNVETTLGLAEAAVSQILATPAAPAPASDASDVSGPASPVTGRPGIASRLVPATGVRGEDGRLVASLSLDADNLWSYLKTHGDPQWQARPGYLSALGPRLLDAYGRHHLTATVFVVGHDAATDEGVEFVASLAAAGHEIGNHSFEHEPWLHLYSRDQLEEELARTEQAVVAAGAARPTGFRGPGYSLSPTLLELLERRGYTYDATTLPTWIGPLARAYYFRSAGLSADEREQRQALFGSAREGLRPVGPYRWRSNLTPDSPGAGLVELPVTTMPGLKVPIHVSYVIHLHQINPALARRYVATALRMCRVAGIGPSILLHPLDLLDRDDAPGLEFFPGMALPSAEKSRVLDHVLSRLTDDFDVVGTGEHARLLGRRPLRTKDPATAGISGPTPTSPAEQESRP